MGWVRYKMKWKDNNKGVGYSTWSFFKKKKPTPWTAGAMCRPKPTPMNDFFSDNDQENFECNGKKPTQIKQINNHQIVKRIGSNLRLTRITATIALSREISPMHQRVEERGKGRDKIGEVPVTGRHFPNNKRYSEITKSNISLGINT